jgi:ADP-heptose:LPS heptosyltransferase
VYVAPIAQGLGDLIVSLPVLQFFIDCGEETYLICRSPRQEGVGERIQGLAGEVRESEFSNARLQAGDRFVNLRDHPFQQNHLWGSPEFEAQFGTMKMTQIVDYIAQDMGIAALFHKLRPLRYKQLSELRGAIVLVPGTDVFQKHWPNEYWLELHSMLVNQGLKVFILGIPEQSPPVRQLRERGVEWFPTPSMGDAIDAVSSCRAVVSVDTGLMHIAVHQGKPTVAFFVNPALYCRLESNCQPLIAKACADICEQHFAVNADVHKTKFGWFDNKQECQSCLVDISESCMGSIYPRTVLDALFELDVLKPVPCKTGARNVKPE